MLGFRLGLRQRFLCVDLGVVSVDFAKQQCCCELGAVSPLFRHHVPSFFVESCFVLFCSRSVFLLGCGVSSESSLVFFRASVY